MPPIRAQARLAQASSAESEIEQTVNTIAEDFLALADRLETEFELALDPRHFRTITVVGFAEMTQAQVLGAISTVATRLEALVLKVLQPPLGPYATPAATELLSSSKARIQAVRETIGEVPPEGSPGEKSGVVEDYADTYLGPITEVIKAAEELVVMRENENIPVYENDEKNGGLGFWKVTLVAGVLVGLIALGTTSAKQTETR